ncbi:hypothetical protein Desaci_1503 [Desulfosporosinus acidiphilus SJ4]|uniref:DUF998 domain-containing protein n=1 Tax=Desulfosporosinus acidiphilus (strain DSM 22704 / JCM 16185 / SJ4) TaxID=646529 RepID=I4D3Z2_DESAJ|nr:DUF998 domain-containing protein [Desulfosporosinus acidiphilus]AFM40516.1 hypothetical protein Desaci_1503 [Desulfosporosinus acidiphilus SJ4]
METVRKILLIFGILSSLLYIVTDILSVMHFNNYSYISQSVSELQAIGSPTRPFTVLLYSIYNVLVVAFGIGLLMTDRRKRTRFTVMLLIGYGIVEQVTMLFFPMHLRGVKKTIIDIMHLTLTSVTAFIILLVTWVGSTLYGKWFRIYSIGTILILLLFWALAGFDGLRVLAELPTPWMGIKERITIYASLLWQLVLGINTLRSKNC